jgi:hypothetical protein
LPSKSIASMRRKLPRTELRLPAAAEQICDELMKRGFADFAGKESRANKDADLFDILLLWLRQPNRTKGSTKTEGTRKVWNDPSWAGFEKYLVQTPFPLFSDAELVEGKHDIKGQPSLALEAARSLLLHELSDGNIPCYGLVVSSKVDVPPAELRGAARSGIKVVVEGEVKLSQDGVTYMELWVEQGDVDDLIDTFPEIEVDEDDAIGHGEPAKKRGKGAPTKKAWKEIEDLIRDMVKEEPSWIKKERKVFCKEVVKRYKPPEGKKTPQWDTVRDKKKDVLDELGWPKKDS